MTDRAAIAYHEAGHAVAAWSFNLAVDRVSIEGLGDGEDEGKNEGTDAAAGHVARDYGGEKSAVAQGDDAAARQFALERSAIVALAGEAAQRRYRPESVQLDYARADRARVHKALNELAGEGDPSLRNAWWRLLELRTERLIAQHWPRIEWLATVLLKQTTLTGKAVTEAIADAALPLEYRGMLLSLDERLNLAAPVHGAPVAPATTAPLDALRASVAAKLAEQDANFAREPHPLAALEMVQVAAEVGAPLPPHVTAWLGGRFADYLNGTADTLVTALGLASVQVEHEPRTTPAQDDALAAPLGDVHVLASLGVPVDDAAAVVAGARGMKGSAGLARRYRANNWSGQRERDQLHLVTLTRREVENILASYPDNPADETWQRVKGRILDRFPR
jgi:hypothetical protein